MGTGKYEIAKKLVIQAVKVALKYISSKRIHMFKVAGVDENTKGWDTMFFQSIDQLMRWGPIEIAR